MAHLFQTQWAICPNGFEFWAEPWPQHIRNVYLSLYLLLLRMLVVDLYAKIQHNTCKGIKKKSENGEIY